MTIDGEGPFIGKRVTICKRKTDERTIVVIQDNCTGIRYTTTYARYLMSVKENRILTKNEHADHKDEDKTNDNIFNLQILTQKENIIKNLKFRNKIGRTYVECVCPVCCTIFTMELKRYTESLENRMHIPVCSVSCAGHISVQKSTGQETNNCRNENAYIEEDGYVFDKYVIGYYK